MNIPKCLFSVIKLNYSSIIYIYVMIKSDAKN